MRTGVPFSFLAILLVLTVAACAPVEQSAPEPVVDVAAEEQAVRDLSMKWMEAYNNQDRATIDSLTAQNAVTIFDGEIHEGVEAIQANRAAEWAENPDGIVSWTINAVEVAASGDLAIERGSWTFDPDGGGEAAEEYGEYVTNWKKMDGQWRMMVDAGTTLKTEKEVDEDIDP